MKSPLPNRHKPKICSLNACCSATLQFGRQSEKAKRDKNQNSFSKTSSLKSRPSTRTSTVIDEGGRPEPELCAVLAGGIHDAEVVLAVAEQHVFLALRELGDASHQILNLVVSFPVKRRHQLKRKTATAASIPPSIDGLVVSPCFCCHDFSSVLLGGITITGENLKSAVSGKHPQIHKHLWDRREERELFIGPFPAVRRERADSRFTCCLKSFS